MTHLARPLVAALLALLAGLLPALRFAPDPRPLLLAGLAAALAVLVLPHLRALRDPRLTHLLLLCAFGLSGAALGSLGARRASEDCRRSLPDQARVRVEGVLAASSAGADDAGAAPLPLAHAVVLGAGMRCSGAVRVRLPEGFGAAPAGTAVSLAGEWLATGPADLREGWPSDPAFAGLFAADSLLRLSAPDVRAHPLLVLRGRTDSLLRRLFPRHEALAEALLLNRRERVDPEVRDRFARSGLVHLLAISGSHVGLLAGIVLLLGGALRLPRRPLVWASLLCLAAYLAMIGAPASAVRAGIMLSLGLVAGLLQRPSAALPIVAAAALTIAAVEPLAVLNPGFQLSFAGVLGILAGRRRLLDLIPAPWRRGALARPIVEGMVMSACAFAATAPVTAHHFGQVAPVAVLANLPAVPLMGLALSGVVGALLLAPLSFPLARLVADGAGLALDALDAVARLAAEVPLGHLAVVRPAWGLWLVAGVAALIALDAAARLRTPIRLAVAGGAAVALLLAAPALAGAGGGEAQVHFIDVGQGDAVAIRTPAGRWMLIDAGPRSRSFDAGERRVLPFLRAQRARRLEALVLTHPDLDHIGGAPAVLRGIPVRSVVEPGLPVGKESYLEVLGEVERRGIAWRAARAGRSMELDGVRLDFLWPTAESLDGVREANQISAVVRLNIGDFSLLLTGDVDEEVERRLVERYGDGLRAQVLKAGHHGSATSTSAALLTVVRPSLVVVSAGRRNRYGHPAPEVIARLRSAGIQIARTDRDGTVTLRVSRGPGGRWRREEP